MKTKILSIAISIFIFSANSLAQQAYQTFSSAGFKVQCGCKLYKNSLFIEMAESQGINNIKGAYVCIENESNPDRAVAYNINIYDNSKDYANMSPAHYGFYEKKLLEQYASNLKDANMRYTMTTYKGEAAIEYTLYQFGDVPTKALFFLKNQKSYLLQVGTREGVNNKFNALKSSFTTIN